MENIGLYTNCVNIQTLSIDEIKSMDEIYICPSFKCNLNCSHCYLNELKMNTDMDNVIQTIKYINQYNSNVMYDLFGGEPLLNNETILSKIYNEIKNHTYHVSTNLLAYNSLSYIHNELIMNAEYIDTSWNPQRFTEEQYNVWIDNVIQLRDSIKINFMITLTDDLIQCFSVEQFYQKVLEWEPYCVEFDFLIGKESDLVSINQWLVELYKIWKTKVKFNLAEKCKKILKTHSVYRDCHNNWSIFPNGSVKQYCPYYENKHVKMECMICEYYTICQGVCPIQSHCTFPKQLYEYIKENIND